MISQEQNDLMTRVGPGTPAGKLLRNYWQPVALVDQFLNSSRPVLADQGTRRRIRIVSGMKKTSTACSTATARTAAPTSPTAATRTASCAACSTAGCSTSRASAWRRRPSPQGSRLCEQHPAALLPGRRAQRHRVRVAGRGRALRLPALRLLHRARCLHLRLQGLLGLQLAAGAGSRHRPGARLLPAPLLRGRGHRGQLRQAVPRQALGLRAADLQGAARVRPARDHGGAHRLRHAARHAAQDRRAGRRTAARRTSCSRRPS